MEYFNNNIRFLFSMRERPPLFMWTFIVVITSRKNVAVDTRFGTRTVKCTDQKSERSDGVSVIIVYVR